jgi:glutathione S-transferase
MLKIHHLPRARGLRVVWQCEEMGLPYEIAPVSFPVPESYRKLNPIGALPFLEDEGGVAMNESVAMMLYLANKYGPTPLLPGKDDPALAPTMQFTVFGEGTLGALGNVLMAARFFAPDAEKKNWSVGAAAGRLQTALDFVADKLGDQDYLAGDRFTLADISVGYVIGITRSALAETVKTPAKLLAYHDQLTARPAYQRAAAAK